MADRSGKAAAVIPTEEDIRAARFVVQIHEEAKRDRMTPDRVLSRRYYSTAHRIRYKRGDRVLVRYNLILSPIMSAEDEATIEDMRQLYGQATAGPLIWFSHDHGKRGRFAGLALRAIGDMVRL